jgi:hypothetical protein
MNGLGQATPQTYKKRFYRSIIDYIEVFTVGTLGFEPLTPAL